jgi:hypothetical protein
VVTGAPVEELLTGAEAAFGKRPDVAQVRSALGQFRSAAVADAARVEGPIGVVRTAAWLLEHGATEDRVTLADEALAAGEQCQARAPGSAPCDYWQAVAKGLGAREHPLTAVSELAGIIGLLKKADASAPLLDDAGPARVLALLLVKAPGWPVGPGDVEEALEVARTAVARAPGHPLAACLVAAAHAEGPREAYAKAAELGRARGDADGAEWAAQAEAALKKIAP